MDPTDTFTTTPADTQGTGQQMNAENSGLVSGGIITAAALDIQLVHDPNPAIAGLGQGTLMAQQSGATVNT